METDNWHKFKKLKCLSTRRWWGTNLNLGGYLVYLMLIFGSVGQISGQEKIKQEMSRLWQVETSTDVKPDLIVTEISNLKSKDISKKLCAIEKLGKARDKNATAELLKELKAQKRPYIRARVVEALSVHQDSMTVKEIVNLLKTDLSADVRFSAAYSLGYSKDESVVPSLIETFLNEKEAVGVRLQASNALTNYSAKEEIYQCFLKGLDNLNPVIRVQSITSLSLIYGATDKERIIPLLKKKLDDKEESVRNAAKERLEILGIK